MLACFFFYEKSSGGFGITMETGFYLVYARVQSSEFEFRFELHSRKNDSAPELYMRRTSFNTVAFFSLLPISFLPLCDAVGFKRAKRGEDFR
jgi:hypothetical protein